MQGFSVQQRKDVIGQQFSGKDLFAERQRSHFQSGPEYPGKIIGILKSRQHPGFRRRAGCFQEQLGQKTGQKTGYACAEYDRAMIDSPECCIFLFKDGKKGSVAAYWNDGKTVSGDLYAAAVTGGKVQKAITLKTAQQGKIMQYDFTVDLAALGVDRRKLEQGFRFNILVNENDGSGRDGYFRIAPGIGMDPTAVHSPVLEPEK